MSVRINQRWPDGLKERIEARVGRSKVTEFTVEALEAALGGSGSGDTSSVSSPRGSGSLKEVAPTESPASPRASEPPEWVEVPPLQVRECERCQKIYTSPTLRRCNVCNGKILPEPE